MNTKVNLAGVQLKNPVMTCSGTFGSGMEYGEMVDLNRLGAVVTKGIANVPWPGNPTPRVTEVYGGMLNAIGLQGPGVDVFIERDIPFLKQYDTKIIVNVCGKTKEDYLDVVERLGGTDVDMLEINISCPNVHGGGAAFGAEPKSAAGPDLSIYLREAEKTLATRFGRKVHIINGRKKGKIELEYYNPEDLNTLLELLEQLPSAGKGGVSL